MFIVVFVIGSLLFVFLEFLIYFSTDWQALVSDVQDSLKPSVRMHEPDILK